MGAQQQARRVLIFNQQTKDATALLRNLWQIMASATSQWLDSLETVLHQAIFCTNIPWEQIEAPDLERVSMTYSGGPVEDLKLQHELAECWSKMRGGVHRDRGANG
ncbi:hypothetical protein NHQ30_007548 [Ciborinia camelliae]|nr:hypothetical protein NHQ30_007548 [Ciborinia camelliae]